MNINGIPPAPLILPPVQPAAHADVALRRNARPLDPAIAAPLQRAMQLGTNPLSIPEPVQLQPGLQRRLQDIGANLGPDLRMVLAEVGRQDRERELGAKLSQAKVDEKYFAGKYAAIDKSQEASDHRLQAGITEGAAQVLGGLAEAGAGAKALRSGIKGLRASDESAKHQETIQKESKGLADDHGQAMQLKADLQTLKQKRPSNEGQTSDTDLDPGAMANERQIAAKHDELALVEKSIQDRQQRIDVAQKAIAKAQRDGVKHKAYQDALPAIGRGINAALTGTGNAMAAFLKHEAEFDDAEAERMRVGNEMHQALSKRLEDEAGTANAGHRKTDDLWKELNQAETGAVRFA